MKLYKIFATAVSSLLFCASAHAAIIYQNGSLDPTSGGVGISAPQSISNSFEVTGNAAIITRVTFGSVVPNGVTPLTLSYSIGDMAFGNEHGSGNVALSNTYQSTFDDGSGTLFDLFLSSFALTSDTLDPGIYWLTLSDATSTDPNAVVGWNISGGPSMARYATIDEFGQPETGDAGDSEFFILEGRLANEQPGQVPEPASLAIVLGGLASLAMTRRRKASM